MQQDWSDCCGRVVVVLPEACLLKRVACQINGDNMSGFLHNRSLSTENRETLL